MSFLFLSFFSGRGVCMYLAASHQWRGEKNHIETQIILKRIPGTAALTRSVKMLGRARRGRGVAVAAVHGGVDGALASGAVDHPVPNVLVPLETRCEKAWAQNMHSGYHHIQVTSSSTKGPQEPSRPPDHVYIEGRIPPILCKQIFYS